MSNSYERYFRAKVSSVESKLVLLAIAMHSDPGGRCQWDLEQIAKGAEIESREVLNRCLNELVDLGWISLSAGGDVVFLNESFAGR